MSCSVPASLFICEFKMAVNEIRWHRLTLETSECIMVCFMVVWNWAPYWCPVIHLVAQATEFTTICCSSVVQALYFSFHQRWLLLSEILKRASLGHYGLSGTEEAALQSHAENNKDEPGNCINKFRLRSKFSLKSKVFYYCFRSRLFWLLPLPGGDK